MNMNMPCIAPFTSIMLSNLYLCINGVMISYSSDSSTSSTSGTSGNDSKDLRTSLLSSRNRATLLHQIIKIGDSINDNLKGVLSDISNASASAGTAGTAGTAGDIINSKEKSAHLDTSDVWLQSKEAFMSLLDT